MGRPGRAGTEPPRLGQWAWAGAVAEDLPRPLQTPGDSHTAAAMATNKERLFAAGALGPGSGYPGAGFPFAFPGALRGSPPFEMLSPSFRGLGQPDLPKEMASLCESQGSWGNEGKWKQEGIWRVDGKRVGTPVRKTGRGQGFGLME